MSRLIIQYIKDGKDLLANSELKVKIDEDAKFEVKKGSKSEIEIESGTHTVKYYFTGYGKSDICGYDEKEIQITSGDNYYVYKTPILLTGKGKLIKCEDEADFNKKIKVSVYLKILAIIITFILAFIACYLYF